MEITMTPNEYAERLLKENFETMEHYIDTNGIISAYLAIWGSIVVCKIQVDGKQENSNEHIFYIKSLIILQEKFVSFCLENKNELIATKSPNKSMRGFRVAKF